MALLRPYPDDELEEVPVSTRVNSPTHEQAVAGCQRMSVGVVAWHTHRVYSTYRRRVSVRVSGMHWHSLPVIVAKWQWTYAAHLRNRRLQVRILWGAFLFPCQTDPARHSDAAWTTSRIG